MRFSVLVASSALLVATPVFAQSSPETAAPGTPALAPVTGTSTVGQPGTPATPTAHYHHIIHRIAHHRHHHRIAHHAATKSDKARGSQESDAGTPSPH